MHQDWALEPEDCRTLDSLRPGSAHSNVMVSLSVFAFTYTLLLLVTAAASVHTGRAYGLSQSEFEIHARIRPAVDDRVGIDDQERLIGWRGEIPLQVRPSIRGYTFLQTSTRSTWRTVLSYCCLSSSIQGGNASVSPPGRREPW